MDSEKDFEVLFKDRNPGNLTIIIKRKTPSRFDLSSSSLSSHDGSSPEYEYNCNDVLSTTKRSDDSLLSFYSRPDESYETLIQMAFEDVCDEQRDRGLQAHDIAQWLCRKFPYFATIKSLLQCVTYRLTSSKLFEKHRVGKNIVWKWNRDDSASFIQRTTNHDAKFRSVPIENNKTRKRNRKRPNFFSINWNLDNRKKKKSTEQDDCQEHYSSIQELKNEVTEPEEVEDILAHIDFLKNSKGIVQPCSPEKNVSSKKIALEGRKFVNAKQKSLFTYLGLVCVELNWLEENCPSKSSINNPDSFLSDSPLLASPNCSSVTYSITSPDKTTAVEPNHKKLCSTKTDMVSPCNSHSSKRGSPFSISQHQFNTSSCPDQPGKKTTEKVNCNAEKFKENAEANLFERFSEIKADEFGGVAQSPLTSSCNSEKKKRLLCDVTLPTCTAIQCFDWPGNKDTATMKKKNYIVPGDNGSPLFPTIKSIYSMRKKHTPQKVCITSCNNGSLPHYSPSAWNKVRFSSPITPKNKIFLTNQVTPVNVLQRRPVNESMTGPLYSMPVPQVYSCFVPPPMATYSGQPSQFISLTNWAHPTWTRDVMQSIMTTTLPERCLFHPTRVSRHHVSK